MKTDFRMGLYSNNSEPFGFSSYSSPIAELQMKALQKEKEFINTIIAPMKLPDNLFNPKSFITLMQRLLDPLIARFFNYLHNAFDQTLSNESPLIWIAHALTLGFNESKLEPDAINKNSTASGLLQITASRCLDLKRRFSNYPSLSELFSNRDFLVNIASLSQVPIDQVLPQSKFHRSPLLSHQFWLVLTQIVDLRRELNRQFRYVTGEGWMPRSHDPSVTIRWRMIREQFNYELKDPLVGRQIILTLFHILGPNFLYSIRPIPNIRILRDASLFSSIISRLDQISKAIFGSIGSAMAIGYFSLPPEKGSKLRITSYFNPSRSAIQLSDGTTVPKGHFGIDISVPVGTPIFSPIVGVVVSKFNSKSAGLTLRIKILEPPYEGFVVEFMHLKSIPLSVQPGTFVKKGDLIAKSGNSGQFTTGPHLHIGVKDVSGRYVDPLTLRIDWNALLT